ncbi:MAG: hypothetical protein RQ754_09105 [Desulfuromonadales bacterium]|nr:hypothetical protein [Desulfuromonadales bacterium]
MVSKELTVAFYRCEWPRRDWSYSFPRPALDGLLREIEQELQPFGVALRVLQEDLTISVNGYADVLNSVRLRYPAAGLGNVCLGHVIGSSPNADLVEDLRRGISRLVFAPETIEPDGSDKIVCHNCGCGC